MKNAVVLHGGSESIDSSKSVLRVFGLREDMKLEVSRVIINPVFHSKKGINDNIDRPVFLARKNPPRDLFIPPPPFARIPSVGFFEKISPEPDIDGAIPAGSTRRGMTNALLPRSFSYTPHDPGLHRRRVLSLGDTKKIY